MADYQLPYSGDQIKAAIGAALNPDQQATPGSQALITSGAVSASYSAFEEEINRKQDILTFDDAPTEDSTNPVTSGGVFSAEEALKQMIVSAYPSDIITDVPVASFPNGADDIPIKSATFSIATVQDGGGVPSPGNVRPIVGWTGLTVGHAAFAGKLIPTSGNHWELNGISVDYVGAGTYHIHGTSTAFTNIRIPIESFTFPSADGRLFEMHNSNGNAAVTLVLLTSSGRLIDTWAATPANKSYSNYSAMVGKTVGITGFDIVASNTVDMMMSPTFLENKQPDILISWQTEAGTVYGGTLTDNGNGTWTLKAKPYYASYNGEALVGPWVSSIDVYAEGVTPTTGAQVVDLGGTETVYTLTAESIKTLLWQNSIFADTGDVDELTYCVDPAMYHDDTKQDVLDFDDTPTEDSTNPVTSGGVYDALLKLYPTDTITDAPVASFSDGADNVPVKSLTVSIDPIQDLHGYENPWPAGGGKNKFPPSSWELRETDGIVATLDGNEVVLNGKATSTVYINLLDFTPGITSEKAWVLIISNQINADVNMQLRNDAGNSFTKPFDATELSGTFYGNTASSVYGGWLRITSGTELSNFRVKGMLVDFAYVLTSFAPYSNICPISGWTGANITVSPTPDAADGTTYPVSWESEAGTVYGGTLRDNGDGTWTLTAIYADVDLTTGMIGGTAGSGYVFYKSLTNAKTVPNSQIAPIVAEAYVPVRYNVIASSPYMIAIRDNGAVYVNTGSADVQPVGKAIYELASPQTYTITAETVKTLLGDNNIWADTGDVASLVYRADVGLYIAKKLGENT